MTTEKPKRTIWDLARTAAKVGLPVLRGDIPSTAMEVFLAVFDSPYAKRYEEYIEKNLKDIEERLRRLESACLPSEGQVLSDTDFSVLATLCEIAVETDRDFLVEDPGEIVRRTAHRGVDEKALVRSLRFLEEVGCVKGHFHVNMAAEDVPRVTVLHDGFQLYLRDGFAGYADLYRIVVWFVVKQMESEESLRYGDVIANSNFPPVYIIHILDDLERKGLLKARIQGYPRDLSLIYGVSETLRRAIDR